MQSNLFIVLVFVIFGNVVFSANSDGKDFVFNFVCYDPYFNSAITTTVIVIPSYNDSICTFEYTQKSKNKVVSIQKTASYGKTNEISFDHNQVLLRTYASNGEIKDFAVKDFRIFASCTEEYTDLFNIPSISNAGNKYTFSMTSADYDQKGWVTILPITQLNSIKVNIVGYADGALFSNETVEYDTTIGQNQHYIAIVPLYEYDFNSSITISASSNFFVTYINPFASTSNNPDAPCGTSCYRDYTTFMMMPVVEKKCNDIISPSDQRMITNDFTTRLYVSPPSVPYDCNETFTMNIYDKEDNINGYQEIITSMGSSTIELTDKSEMASSTNAGQMPMYRLGSVLNHPDSLTAYGHFTHYVPSVQEW
uniref:CUB_2 domain-containing protein n=1 Tax=Rhabditophanes sp. KR3021 TaxID=114890 RepID=A0AC35TRW0_9BILA